MKYSISTIKAVTVVINHGPKPFYSADLGLTGAQMKALKEWGFIKETGKKKETFIVVGCDYEGELYRLKPIKEWQLNVDGGATFTAQIDQVRKDVEELFQTVSYLKSAGW